MKTLKEKRKFVAEYAKKANEILQETRAENPDFLKGQWNGALTKSTIATKKGTFRQSAPYRMNTEQLNKYLTKLNQFVRDIEHKKKDKARYEDVGYSGGHNFIESLKNKFWDYFYGGYDEFCDRTPTILQNIALSGDMTEQEAFAFISSAFESCGAPNLPKQERPNITQTAFFDIISQGGKYL